MRVGSEAGEGCRRHEKLDDGYMEFSGTFHPLKINETIIYVVIHENVKLCRLLIAIVQFLITLLLGLMYCTKTPL